MLFPRVYYAVLQTVFKRIFELSWNYYDKFCILCWKCWESLTWLVDTNTPSHTTWVDPSTFVLEHLFETTSYSCKRDHLFWLVYTPWVFFSASGYAGPLKWTSVDCSVHKYTNWTMSVSIQEFAEFNLVFNVLIRCSAHKYSSWGNPEWWSNSYEGLQIPDLLQRFWLWTVYYYHKLVSVPLLVQWILVYISSKRASSWQSAYCISISSIKQPDSSFMLRHCKKLKAHIDQESLITIS